MHSACCCVGIFLRPWRLLLTGQSAPRASNYLECQPLPSTTPALARPATGTNNPSPTSVQRSVHTFVLRVRAAAHSNFRFSPSMARAVSEEVCKAVLDEKVWTGEGEEVVWTVQITESVKEKVKGVCTLPLTSPRSHPFHTHASTPFRPPSASAHPGRLCTRLSPHLRPSLELPPLQDNCANNGWAAKAAGCSRGVSMLVGRGRGQLQLLHLPKRHALGYSNGLWALR